MVKEERVSPGRWGGRSGPGETNAECSGFILGENRCVPVGVGQSGSRHIGETFDALGTSLRNLCVLPIQLLHAYWTRFSSLYSLNFFLCFYNAYTQSLCQFIQRYAKSFTFKERLRSTADKSLIPGCPGKVSGLMDDSIEVAETCLGYFQSQFRPVNRFNRKHHCVILTHQFNCGSYDTGGPLLAAI